MIERINPYVGRPYTARDMVRAYYFWVWPAKYDPKFRDGYKPHPFAKRRYAKHVRQLKAESQYAKQDVRYSRIRDGALEQELMACEHCMVKRLCMLVKVVESDGSEAGFISGDEPGDWTCGKCDPRVADMLVVAEMENLVGVN